MSKLSRRDFAAVGLFFLGLVTMAASAKNAGHEISELTKEVGERWDLVKDVKALEATKSGDLAKVGHEELVKLTAGESEYWYDNFNEAFLKARSLAGDSTITLLKDVSDETDVTYGLTNGANLTVDLSGHTLTTQRGFYVTNGTVRFSSSNGQGKVIFNKEQPIGLQPQKTSTPTVTIDENVTIEAGANVSYPVIMWQYGDTEADHDGYKMQFNVNGTLDAKSTDAAAIWVMGNITNTDDGDTSGIQINVGKTGKIISAGGIGIANNGAAHTTIAGTVQAVDTAIEIRNGSLTVEDGAQLISTTIPASAETNNSGTTSKGAALAIASYGLGPINVNIKGGLFQAYVPLLESNPNGTSAENLKQTIEVSGGTFTSTNTSESTSITVKGTNVYNSKTVSVYSQNVTKFICGGIFSHQVDANYFKDGCLQYKISKGTDTYYTSAALADLPSLIEDGVTSVEVVSGTLTLTEVLDTMHTFSDVDITVPVSVLSSEDSMYNYLKADDAIVSKGGVVSVPLASGNYKNAKPLKEFLATLDSLSGYTAEELSAIHLKVNDAGKGIDYFAADGTQLTIAIDENSKAYYGLTVWKNNSAVKNNGHYQPDKIVAEVPKYKQTKVSVVTSGDEDNTPRLLIVGLNDIGEIGTFINDAKGTSEFAYQIATKKDDINTTLTEVSSNVNKTVSSATLYTTAPATSITDAQTYKTAVSDHAVDVVDSESEVKYYTLDGTTVTAHSLGFGDALAIAVADNSLTVTGVTPDWDASQSAYAVTNGGEVTKMGYHAALTFAAEATSSATFKVEADTASVDPKFTVDATTVSAGTPKDVIVDSYTKAGSEATVVEIQELVNFIDDNSLALTYTVAGFENATLNVVNGKVQTVTMKVDRTTAQFSNFYQAGATMASAERNFSVEDYDGSVSCAVANGVMTIPNLTACTVKDVVRDKVFFSGSYDNLLTLLDNFKDHSNYGYQGQVFDNVAYELSLNESSQKISMATLATKVQALSSGAISLSVGGTDSAQLLEVGYDDSNYTSVSFANAKMTVDTNYQLTFDADGIPTLTYTGTSVVTGDAIYTELTHWLANTKIANMDKLTFVGTGSTATNIEAMSIADGKLNVTFAGDETVTGSDKIAGTTTDFAALFVAANGDNLTLVTEPVVWSDMSVSYTGEDAAVAMTITGTEVAEATITAAYKSLVKATFPDAIATRTLNVGASATVPDYVLKHTKDGNTDLVTIAKGDFAEGLSIAQTLAGSDSLGKAVGAIWTSNQAIALANVATSGEITLHIVGNSSDDAVTAIAGSVADTFVNVTAEATGTATVLSPTIESFTTDSGKSLSVVTTGSSSLAEALTIVTNINNVTLDTSAQTSNKVSSIVKTTNESTTSAILTMSGLSTTNSDQEASAAAIALAQNNVPYASVNGLVAVDSNDVWIESVTSDSSGVVTVTTKLSAANAKSLAENLNQQLTSSKATRIVVTDVGGEAYQGGVYASLAQAIKGLVADDSTSEAKVSGDGDDDGAVVTQSDTQFIAVLTDGATTDQAITLMSALMADEDIDTNAGKVMLRVGDDEVTEAFGLTVTTGNMPTIAQAISTFTDANLDSQLTYINKDDADVMMSISGQSPNLNIRTVGINLADAYAQYSAMGDEQKYQVREVTGETDDIDYKLECPDGKVKIHSITEGAEQLDTLISLLPDDFDEVVVGHQWTPESSDSSIDTHLQLAPATDGEGLIMHWDANARGQKDENFTLANAVALYNSLSDESKAIVTMEIQDPEATDSQTPAETAYTIDANNDGQIVVEEFTSDEGEKTIADAMAGFNKVVSMLPDIKDDLMVTDGDEGNFTYQIYYMPHDCDAGAYCSNFLDGKVLVRARVADVDQAKSLIDALATTQATYVMMIEFDDSYVAMVMPQTNSTRFSLIRSAHAAETVVTQGVYVVNGVNQAIVTNQITDETQDLMNSFGVSEVMLTTTQPESDQGTINATPVNLLAANDNQETAKQAISDFQTKVSVPNSVLTGDDFTAVNDDQGNLKEVVFDDDVSLDNIKTAMSGTQGTITVKQGDKTYTFVNGKLKESSKNESHSSSSSSNSSSSNSGGSSGGSSSDAKPTGCSANVPVGTPDLFQIDRQGTKATLYFTPVRDNTDRYHVVFGNVAGQELYGGIAMQVDADRNNGVLALDIDNLQPGQQYSFKVAPVNDCAVGTWSNWLTAKGVARYGKTTVKTYRYTGK